MKIELDDLVQFRNLIPGPNYECDCEDFTEEDEEGVVFKIDDEYLWVRLANGEEIELSQESIVKVINEDEDE